MVTHRRFLLALVGFIGAAFTTLAGCDEEEEFFHDCPLSQTLIDACAEDQETAAITCAVKEHPMCDEAVCAQFRGSESFCSRVCTGNGDCPLGSTCQPYLDFAFCVPDEIVNGTVAP